MQYNPPLSNLLAMELVVKNKGSTAKILTQVWLQDSSSRKMAKYAIKSIIQTVINTIPPLSNIFTLWKKNYKKGMDVDLENTIINFQHANKETLGCSPVAYICEKGQTECTYSNIKVYELLHHMKTALKHLYRDNELEDIQTRILISTLPEKPKNLFNDNK